MKSIPGAATRERIHNIEKRTSRESEEDIRIARQYGRNISTGRVTAVMAGTAMTGDGWRLPRI
jgi:hypothetical protein